jgi:hypothetical protein
MNPLTIYQQALDVVSNSVLSGDFAAYVAMIDLPYLVHTDLADIIVTDPGELRRTFDVVSQGLMARGVTHYERVARKADYVGSNRIDGTHYTNMIAQGDRIAAPHVAQQSLVRRGGLWRFSEARYPLAATEWPLTDKVVFFGIADSARQESLV